MILWFRYSFSLYEPNNAYDPHPPVKILRTQCEKNTTVTNATIPVLPKNILFFVSIFILFKNYILPRINYERIIHVFNLLYFIA